MVYFYAWHLNIDVSDKMLAAIAKVGHLEEWYAPFGFQQGCHKLCQYNYIDVTTNNLTTFSLQMKTFAITLSVLVLAIIAQEAYGRPGGFRHRARREAEEFDLQPCNSLNFANGTSVRCEQACNTSFTCVAYGSPSPALPGVLAGAFSGVSLCVVGVLLVHSLIKLQWIDTFRVPCCLLFWLLLLSPYRYEKWFTQNLRFL